MISFCGLSAPTHPKAVSQLPLCIFARYIKRVSFLINAGIPIETIASFKKMKMITEDLDVVVKALKENESEIYELDAESKNIRRKSEVVEQDHTARSVYIKGLPLVDVDAKDPVSELFILQDKIDDLFSEKAKVLCVRLKKTNDRPKKFKVCKIKKNVRKTSIELMDAMISYYRVAHMLNSKTLKKHKKLPS